MYIAKEGGYYQKYGLDVDLQFGVHPAGIAMLTSGQAAMVNHSLEQGMVAGSKDAASFALVGSSSNKGLFALMAQKEFTDPKQLKGKRIAVGQIGDAPYNYIVALLGTYGLGVSDVQWIPVGTDVSGRAAALQTNRADATLLTAPNYFRLEEAGYKTLANLADRDDLRGDRLPVQQESHDGLAEAGARRSSRRTPKRSSASTTTRRSRSKATSRSTSSRRPTSSASTISTRTATSSTACRTCWRPPSSRLSRSRSDPRIAAELKAFDFHKVVDNSTVDRLVKEGFFEQLFGADVKAEEQRKAKLAF